MSVHDHAAPVDPIDVLSRFRRDLYDCLPARRDALFELCEALLCSPHPVTSPAELSLEAEHRRGHGAMYDALANGRLETGRLRRVPAALPLPRTAGGRIVLAADISPWLRSDAPTSPDRLFCHVYGRSESASQFIPGWPYSVVAALPPAARRPRRYALARGAVPPHVRTVPQGREAPASGPGIRWTEAPTGRPGPAFRGGGPGSERLRERGRTAARPAVPSRSAPACRPWRPPEGRPPPPGGGYTAGGAERKARPLPDEGGTGMRTIAEHVRSDSVSAHGAHLHVADEHR
ncbi:transposase [Nocardiopsis sp. CNT-189]|uniref:transposase n=1 Tax=Nocardiopsis oceanisediminis TaxID=2816862 RepID=UPI003B2DC7F0